MSDHVNIGFTTVTGGSLRTSLPEIVILGRLVAALVLGGLIGLDRELKRRPAGLRTHMLVSLAAALFTLITIEIYQEAVIGGQDAARADPIRIVEAVTAGVAFIAAGAIIQSRGDVQGLTTGVAIWLAAAIGVACGIGQYLVALFATLLAVVVLNALGWVERHWLGKDEEGT